MDAADLYQEIKDALATFGLRFNEMEKIEVAFNDDAITFSYANKSLTVRTDDE